MNKHLLILAFAFSLFSCNNDEQVPVNQDTTEQTPEALVEDKSLEISSFDGRFSSNIIEELFEEALEKDQKLQSVIANLNQAQEMKPDSLAAYHLYKRNMQDYWSALHRYALRLSDSTTREQLTSFIKALESKQNQRLSPLDSLVSKIDSSEQSLADMQILMKILVTEPMMNNYFRNEYPSAKSIESVIEAYDQSAQEMEPYTKIVK